MLALNRMKDEQQKRLSDRKQNLVRCNQEASTLDRQIEELSNRLQQKKILTGSLPRDRISVSSQSSTPSSKMHTIVAAVEPLIQQTDPNVSTDRVPVTNSLVTRIHSTMAELLGALMRWLKAC